MFDELFKSPLIISLFYYQTVTWQPHGFGLRLGAAELHLHGPVHVPEDYEVQDGWEPLVVWLGRRRFRGRRRVQDKYVHYSKRYAGSSSNMVCLKYIL